MDAIKTIFQSIGKETQKDLNEPTVIANALGKIEAYAEVGVELIDKNSSDVTKEFAKHNRAARDRIKIVVFLVGHGEKQCELIDGEKLPFENANLDELREAKKLKQKKLKKNKQN